MASIRDNREYMQVLDYVISLSWASRTWHCLTGIKVVSRIHEVFLYRSSIHFQLKSTYMTTLPKARVSRRDNSSECCLTELITRELPFIRTALAMAFRGWVD